MLSFASAAKTLEEPMMLLKLALSVAVIIPMEWKRYIEDEITMIAEWLSTKYDIWNLSLFSPVAFLNLNYISA